AVDGLGDRGGGVAAEVGDVFDADAVAGQERDEAVPQFAGCPGVGIEAGSFQDRAEGAQHVVPVQGGAGGRGEHELVAGWTALALVVGRQGGYAPGGQGQGASGFARLGIAAGADGAPDVNRGR